MKQLNKQIAIVQVLILVIGIIAISYAIGGGVKMVSAEDFPPMERDNSCTTSHGVCTNGISNTCTANWKGGVCIEPKSADHWDQGDLTMHKDNNGNLVSGHIECCYCGTDPALSCFVPDKTNDGSSNYEPDISQIGTSTNTINTDENEDKATSGNVVGTFSTAMGFIGGLDSTKNILTKWVEGNSDKTRTIADLKKLGLSDDKINEILKSKSTAKETINKIDKGKNDMSFLKQLWKSFTGTGKEAGAEKAVGQFAYIGETVMIAALAALAYVKVAKLLGAGVRNLRDLGDAGMWIAGGAAVTAIALTYGNVLGASIFTTAVSTASGASIFGPAGWVVAAAVIIAMGIYTLTSYKDYAREVYSYIPTSWKAQEGGENCDKCNNLEFGCSEYQCKTFGQACSLVNKGTEREACIWNDSKDFEPPIMKPLENILSQDYEYSPLGASTPLSTGVKIDYIGVNAKADGCIPPYTSMNLGVETDELAMCKIDVKRTPSYDDMLSPMMEGDVLVKNHTLVIPSTASASSAGLNASGISEIHNGDEQQFYIRCKDANGIKNQIEFQMEFCVQDGPDTQAPLIIGTNFLSTSYLQYNQSSVPLEIYTNEPADCKWDFDDLDYESMQFNMSQCSYDDADYLNPATFQYGCAGTLAGLQSYEENKIYIRCEDKPWWTDGMTGRRYPNQKSYELNLIGTQPLIIDSITVDGKQDGTIIKDNANIIRPKIEVKTSAGAEEGKAKCTYDYNGFENPFYNNGNTDFVQTNTQKIALSPGAYNISVKCNDAGGNVDTGYITFTLEQDNDAPNVVRAYKDANYLRLVTDETATCVYNTKSNIGCNYIFDDGTPLDNVVGITHYVAWEANTKYYVKCKDEFGNRPAMQNECSLIVQAYEEGSE